MRHTTELLTRYAAYHGDRRNCRNFATHAARAAA